MILLQSSQNYPARSEREISAVSRFYTIARREAFRIKEIYELTKAAHSEGRTAREK